MPNSFYNNSGVPFPNAAGASALIRTEFASVRAAFDLMPTLAGNGKKIWRVNAAGTAVEAVSGLDALNLTNSTVDSSPVGATTPSTGAFTTLTAATYTFQGFTGALLKTNGSGQAVAAVAGTDYQPGIGAVSGLLKANGAGAISAATSGTDYAPATSGSSLLKGNGSGGFGSVSVGSGLSFDGTTLASTSSGGSVTSVSVATANGFAGTVANPGSAPAITLTTSLTGLLAGNGTAMTAVTIGTGLQLAGGTLSSTGSAGSNLYLAANFGGF